MAKKEFAVLGLGEFGTSIAVTLEKSGCQVLAIDRDEERVQNVSERVTHAACADLQDAAVIESLGVQDLDGVIVAIGEDMESSIMATICAKECGARYVAAKASSDIHATILKKLGADEVIFPEQATGVRLAHNLASGNFIDTVELSRQFSMAEVEAPARWVGKSIRQLHLRGRGVNIIARKVGEDVELIADPDRVIEKKDVFIIIGNNRDLEQVIR